MECLVRNQGGHKTGDEQSGSDMFDDSFEGYNFDAVDTASFNAEFDQLWTLLVAQKTAALPQHKHSPEVVALRKRAQAIAQLCSAREAPRVRGFLQKMTKDGVRHRIEELRDRRSTGLQVSRFALQHWSLLFERAYEVSLHSASFAKTRLEAMHGKALQRRWEPQWDDIEWRYFRLARSALGLLIIVQCFSLNQTVW